MTTNAKSIPKPEQALSVNESRQEQLDRRLNVFKTRYSAVFSSSTISRSVRTSEVLIANSEKLFVFGLTPDKS